MLQQTKTSRRVNAKKCRVSKSDFQIKVYYVCSYILIMYVCVAQYRYYYSRRGRKFAENVFTIILLLSCRMLIRARFTDERYGVTHAETYIFYFLYTILKYLLCRYLIRRVLRKSICRHFVFNTVFF